MPFFCLPLTLPRLDPHESPMTDMILLGHSMGGLLSAEVVLLEATHSTQLKHRILGNINFDVPFLGMHPSVIKSGLASIFSPAESPKPRSEAASSNAHSSPMTTSTSGIGSAPTAGQSSAPPALPPRQADFFNSQQVDPNYNPSFNNDVMLPVRQGWRNALHFVTKHHQDLIGATKQLVKAHMEFGGAMADYSGLKARYTRIRALEEQATDIRRSIVGDQFTPPRVRFVNYYTASTGRPKKPKHHTSLTDVKASPSLASFDLQPVPEAKINNTLVGEQDLSVLGEPKMDGTCAEKDKNPHVDAQADEFDAKDDVEDISMGMQALDPLAMSDPSDFDTSDTESWADAMEDVEGQGKTVTASSQEQTIAVPSNGSALSLTQAPSLNDASTVSIAASEPVPPIPGLPQKPTEPDYTLYVDKDTRKLAEKDYARSLKTYERAVRDRERAIRDRERLEERRQKQTIKESKKVERDAEKEAKRKEKGKEKELKRQESSQSAAAEKAFQLNRQQSEKEWKTALEMKWNNEDGTVAPMPSSSSSMVRNPSIGTSSLTPSTSLTPSISLASTQAAAEAEAEAEAKAQQPRKERNFCALPPSDSAGNRDPTWVKVFMPDVDEVGAHCGLFFPTSDSYEGLVGDVADLIMEWTTEAEGERVAAEFEAEI